MKLVSIALFVTLLKAAGTFLFVNLGVVSACCQTTRNKEIQEVSAVAVAYNSWLYTRFFGPFFASASNGGQLDVDWTKSEPSDENEIALELAFHIV